MVLFLLRNLICHEEYRRTKVIQHIKMMSMTVWRERDAKYHVSKCLLAGLLGSRISQKHVNCLILLTVNYIQRFWNIFYVKITKEDCAALSAF